MQAKDAGPVEPSLQQFMALYDEAFVKAVYETVLGRAVDESGLTSYLAHLRAGMHKAQIIGELVRSPEAAERSALLSGLHRETEGYLRSRASIWVRLRRRLLGSSAESTDRQLRVVDNRLFLIEQSMSLQSRQLGDLLQLVKAGQSLVDATRLAEAGPAGPVVHAPPRSHMSPTLARTYFQLKALIGMKLGRN